MVSRHIANTPILKMNEPTGNLQNNQRVGEELFLVFEIKLFKENDASKVITYDAFALKLME